MLQHQEPFGERKKEMTNKLILTGDVNLMNVTDATVPLPFCDSQFLIGPMKVTRARIVQRLLYGVMIEMGDTTEPSGPTENTEH